MEHDDDDEAPLPPPVAPVLDEVDKPAIFALLVRCAAIDLPNKRDRALIEKLRADIAERTEARQKYIAAFDAFGFSAHEPGLFDRVRTSLGDETYDRAVALGFPSENTDVPVLKQLPEDQRFIGRSTDRDASAATVPKISDAILNYLRMVGDRGASVAEIKRHLGEFYGITDIHEKTPGMTLYRLSKENNVRREGRTWFATDATPSAEIGADAHLPEPNTAADQ